MATSNSAPIYTSLTDTTVAKQHLWQPGTDLRAGLFTILHNQHVNSVRSSMREVSGISAYETDLLS